MIITLDTEFLDDGETIEMISIGLVAEDGRTFYGVNADADWARIQIHDNARDRWLFDNVFRHLPMRETGMKLRGSGESLWLPDGDADEVMSRKSIAIEVEAFLRSSQPFETWAYYSANDHVALYQLFGPMIEACRDHAVPMRTSCLKQEEVMQKRRSEAEDPGWWDEYVAPYRPVQDSATEHHALHDAEHDMDLARWLRLTES